MDNDLVKINNSSHIGLQSYLTLSSKKKKDLNQINLLFFTLPQPLLHQNTQP